MIIDVFFTIRTVKSSLKSKTNQNIADSIHIDLIVANQSLFVLSSLLCAQNTQSKSRVSIVQKQSIIMYFWADKMEKKGP